jgi:hypothetical protein
VQSGSTGYADKTGSYAILPIETVAENIKNLCRRVQSGSAGYPDNSDICTVLRV